MGEPVTFRDVSTVFIDRDGVVNRKPIECAWVTQVLDLELLPGSAKAIAKLNAEDTRVIVVTNQRAISLGLMTEQQLVLLHESLKEKLAAHSARLDAIYYCPHGIDDAHCKCRKPATGLFERAFREFPSIDKRRSVVIGDSLCDIEAGRRLGIPTIFVLGDPRLQKQDREHAAALADATVHSLYEAVTMLIQSPDRDLKMHADHRARAFGDT
jgi:D-glycero-D-manno-heptose 1,7-bisphosphate phosphatase